MKPDEWSRVKHHFDDALELAPHAREAWMARLAAETPEVRSEVEALIRSHADASPFLEGPLLIDPEELADALDAQPQDDAATSLPPGTRIGDYEIRREIGRGGMGVVYLAHDVHLARPVALKSLPAQIAGDRRLVERLQREAQAAAAVSHPGIATVYAFLETSEGNFIASEFIQGRTLRQELQQGAVEPARATRLAAEIARALGAAHDAHVVHRDLKPENILITASGAIKIIDFGIARLERADLPALTMPGLVHGTPGYMAPELLVGGATVDGRADVYALGVILAEMVCGHHPLEHEPEGVPAVLEPIIRRCLESEPGRRYRFTRDLLRDLERASLALEMSEPTVVVPTAVRGAMFWWQFHQGLTALVYWLMAVPAWFARELVGGRTGRVLFFVTLGALLFASILRLHLWFTSRLSRDDLPMQVQRERPWILIADLAFAATLIVSGVLLSEARIGFAVLLLAVGIGSAVVALFIEPATARSALTDISDSRPRTSDR